MLESFAQKSGGPTGMCNMYERLKQKYSVTNINSYLTPLDEQINNPILQKELQSAATPTVMWKALANSSDISGVLFSDNKPLNYNFNLNAVTFIYKKGNSTATSSPFNNENSIMMKISQNWGYNWDSTCIFTSDNNSNKTQFPQGGIYNPSINTNVDNAYLVGMGPLTSTLNGDYIGNWYASKSASISARNFTASAVANATQIANNTPPYNPGLAKHDMSMHSFSSTDDGMIRSLAERYTGKDMNGQPINFKGGAVIKGTFNAGTFTWTSDTLIPSTITSTLNNNNLWEHPRMAFNESGTVGYVVFIGASNTHSNNNTTPNKGWQPIVFKTSNSGNSWMQIPGIDFTAPNMTVVLNKLDPINTNSSLSIPFFNVNEGWDIGVDYNGKLHLTSTILSTSSKHNDSLAFTWQYQSPENYDWNHTPGKRPYIYDFTTDGVSTWSVLTVDSMSSEGCGGMTGSPGYNINPWSADPGNNNIKPAIDSRLQLSKINNGQAFIYSWTESDTSFTPSQLKRNVLPNIKARAVTFRQFYPPDISPTEISITRPIPATPPTYTANPNILNKAFFHYATKRSENIYIMWGNVTVVRTLFSVTNNNLNGSSFCNHWLSTSTMEFANMIIIDNLGSHRLDKLNSVVFPNPVLNELSVNCPNENIALIEITDGQGRSIKKFYFDDLNEHVSIPTHDLASGVYLITVKTKERIYHQKIIKSAH